MGVIYLRTNLVNGMQYVGQSKDFKQRENSWMSYKTIYANQYLTRARNKYGLNNFSLEVLENCDNSMLDELEKYWIKHLNTLFPNGYNFTTGGTNGAEFTDEVKQKISKANTGKTPWNKGKTYDQLFDKETANRLRKLTSDFAKTRVGKLNPFYGHHFKVHPRLGKQFSDESKKKIGDANRNGKTAIPIVFIKDETGEVIEYPSERQAVREGFSTGNLSRAVRGVYKKEGNHHYRGGNWFFKEDYKKILGEQTS